MSTSLRSVNNVVRVTQGDDITFIVMFQQRGHNGITFTVNGVTFNLNIKNPDFPCTSEADTSEADTPDVTQTLEVQYHCTAVKPGSYMMEAFVYYCGREYFSRTFAVVAENGKYLTM